MFTRSLQRSLFAHQNIIRNTQTSHVVTRHVSTTSTNSTQPADELPFPSYSGPTELFINNKFVPSISGKKFDVINPGNGEVLTSVYEAQSQDVDVAVDAARAAFHGAWSNKLTPRDRGNLMYRLADLVEKNQEKLASIEALNNGKTLAMARVADAPACAKILRYYAGWCDKINGQTIPIGPGFFNFTRHEAVGVVGAIIPWNLPLIAVAAKLGPALACGNTVVLKTAEQTPLSALLFAQLVQEAGFPAGVINIVSGFGPTAGAAIASHQHVDKISFTGSLEVGKKIQVMAAQSNLKRTTLELGGKNPSIVFADADINTAIDTVHNGLFWNKGEACAAGTRIFVEASIFDEFLEKSVAKARARRVGHPFHPQTAQGALVSEEQMKRVLGFIESAQQQGAELKTGGHRIGNKGYYVEPTVFSNIRDDMTVFSEEVFGPVMTIAKFNTIDEVIQRANNTKYGLAAGVFTKDISKGHEVMSRLRAGLVFWNCYHVVDVSAPFGGYKQSGYGREGGHYGLLPYLEVKNVVIKV